MILTNVVKVTDPTHEQHGNVLVLERVDRENNNLICYEWTGDTFDKDQPRIPLTMDQGLYGSACIITHRPRPGVIEHYLNRAVGPDGQRRMFDEHGVPRNEVFLDSDFKPMSPALVR